jgi:hypothetical protein
MGRGSKATTNEKKHPYVVELSIASDGLAVELSRQIMQFHKSRDIQPQYGRRTTTRRGRLYYRWCFSDLLIARAFAEEFSGEFCKPSNSAKLPVSDDPS